MRNSLPFALRPVFGALALGLLATASTAAGEPDLGRVAATSRRTTDAVDRVEISLEVGGDLKVADGKAGGKPVDEKLSVAARLAYEERSLVLPSEPDRPLRALRHYDQIDVVNKVGEGTFQPQLRDTRRLIGVEVRAPKVLLFSPNGALTREELDLIDLPGNSLLVDRLLPDRPVAPQEAWKPPSEAVAALCSLESVKRCDVQCVLTEATGANAKFEMSGSVSGALAGQSTKIELKAKYRFDRKTARIDWFAMALQESRAIGPMGPGLEVVAKLQMKITPVEKSARLGDEAVKHLVTEPSPELQQLSYASVGGGWQMAHDRRWVVITEKGDAAVLRMADQGEYLAQCSITAVAAGSQQKPVSLSDFQDEIRQALGKNFGQFVRAAQTPGEAGYQVYRVEVVGAVSDVPVQWIYSMVLDGQGRRAVLAFVVQGSMSERFGQADQEMVRALRFVDSKVAAKR